MRYALQGQYPIETVDQLKKTAEYFDKYLTRFHPKERVVAANSIEKRAMDLGVYIDMDWVKNYSRPMKDEFAVSPDFHRNMTMRKHACLNKTVNIGGKEIKASVILDGIEKEIEKMSALVVVDELLDFDKLANLEYQWDKGILDPVMTVFGSLSNPEYDAKIVVGNFTDYGIKKMAGMEDVVEIVGKKIGKKASQGFFKNPVEVAQRVGEHEREAINSILSDKEKKK
jgi:hypothetical protein